MEKRLLLSIALSLLILYVWAGFTRPNKPQLQSNISQVAENKEDKNDLYPDSPPPAVLEEISPKDSDEATKNKGKIATLSNDKIQVEFSSNGAVIVGAQIIEYEKDLPISDIGSINGFEAISFETISETGKTITYRHKANDLEITTKYQLSDDDYTLSHSTYVKNTSKMSKLINIMPNGIVIDGSRMDITGKNARDKALNEYVVNSYSGILRKNNAFKFAEKEEKDEEGHVVWTAFRDRYYAVIVKPDYESVGYNIERVSEERLDINIATEKKELRAGEGVSFESIIFIGPERYDILKSYDLGLEKVKKFYRFGLFDLIAKAIYNFMHFVHKFVPNWGACILIVSAVIYFSMYPLTLRGMASMKRMQSMQPQISALKEKYKDNPQKMNQEMMQLYKDNKINPIGGCLPFLLQMPIFIGLYQVLWRSVSFKHAEFLWIKDLSQPDRFYTLPVNVPFLGNEINLLPILMMVIMFFQQRITSKNMTVTDPMQKQQQKMMGIFMPIVLGVIFYKFASGLTLYFTMFYLFSTFTQFKIYKQKQAENG